MPFKVVITEKFSQTFKKFSKNQEFKNALGKKIKHLKEDPDSIGGHLSGELHGYKGTRLVGKYRIVFKISPETNEVFLLAIDHRKFDYERF